MKKHKEKAVPAAFQRIPPRKPKKAVDGVMADAKVKKLRERRDELLDDPVAKPADEPVPLWHDDRIALGQNPINDQNLAKLGRIFEWVVAETVTRLANINDSLAYFNKDPIKGQAAYEEARKAFSDFTACLDNPHPAYNPDPERQGKCNGVTMKWAYVETETNADGFYSGAKIIVRWAGGSHISSSSVP